MLLHISQNSVWFGDFLPMRTLCDAYHEEFESHTRPILDISTVAWVLNSSRFSTGETLVGN